jgi:transcriptional regulator with XRE-family HTH domain
MLDPIEVLRKRLGDGTQRELAGVLGISPQYLNDILSGHREPGPKLLEGLGLERIVTYRRKRA